MRNFTATVKERRPGEPCFVQIEMERRVITLEVRGDADVARNLAGLLRRDVASAKYRLLPAAKR